MKSDLDYQILIFLLTLFIKNKWIRKILRQISRRSKRSLITWFRRVTRHSLILLSRALMRCLSLQSNFLHKSTDQPPQLCLNSLKLRCHAFRDLFPAPKIFLPSKKKLRKVANASKFWAIYCSQLADVTLEETCYSWQVSINSPDKPGMILKVTLMFLKLIKVAYFSLPWSKLLLESFWWTKLQRLTIPLDLSLRSIWTLKPAEPTESLWPRESQRKLLPLESWSGKEQPPLF